MNCNETVERLNQYLDRELTEGEIAAVQQHLDDCPPCGHLFHYEAALRRLVRQACCEEAAPIELRDRILHTRP